MTRIMTINIIYIQFFLISFILSVIEIFHIWDIP